jgi:hypothetical protein
LLGGLARLVAALNPADHIGRGPELSEPLGHRLVSLLLEVCRIGEREVGDTALQVAVDERPEPALRPEWRIGLKRDELHLPSFARLTRLPDRRVE